MLKNSKNILTFSNANLKNNLLYKMRKEMIASKRHNTYFDIQVDWYVKGLLSKGMTISKFLAVLNVSLFLYANLRYGWENRWKAIEGVSYSLRNFITKDYLPIFPSLLGSYKVEDLVLETGILLTVGQRLEKLHGSPFIFKLFVFSFYIGILSSLWWVQSNHAKRERYHVPEPLNKTLGSPQSNEYRFMSSHGFCMSLVYFWLYKNPSMRLLILPVLGLDLAVWGPYYSPGAITGVAAGMIL